MQLFFNYKVNGNIIEDIVPFTGTMYKGQPSQIAVANLQIRLAKQLGLKFSQLPHQFRRGGVGGPVQRGAGIQLRPRLQIRARGGQRGVRS